MSDILREIEFHDLQVSRICIDFFNQTLDLVTVIANDDSLLKFQSLKFFDIDKLEFEEMSDITFEDVEITECVLDLGETENRIQLTFLLGFGKPSWNLGFCFSRVESEGWSVPEANSEP